MVTLELTEGELQSVYRAMTGLGWISDRYYSETRSACRKVELALEDLTRRNHDPRNRTEGPTPLRRKGRSARAKRA